MTAVVLMSRRCHRQRRASVVRRALPRAQSVPAV